MAQPFKFSMVFTADNSQAKSATQEVDKALQQSGRAAEAFGGKAAQGFSAFAGSAGSARTAMQELVAATTGLDRTGSGVSAANTALAAYGAQLDALQAKFDPLFAAQQRYRQAVEDIDRAQGAGVVSASQAIDLRLRERNAFDAVTAAAERTALAKKKAAEDIVGRATITPDRRADIAAYGAQLDSLRAKYNPLFAVTQRYKQEVAEIRQAHRAGAISADEMTAAISRQRQATLASIDAIKGRNVAMMRGGGFGIDPRFRRQNLGYQAFDIGQGVASGMPLGMVGVQQLPQIIQLYAGQGGLKSFLSDFSAIGRGALGVLNPLTLGIGALTAAVGVGAGAYNSYLTSMKSVETAATGLGRTMAGTTAEMEASAEAGAAAAGISIGAARSMQTAFLRTGKIGSENFEDLIGISRDFAATIGIAASDSGDALAKMFADPAKAADTLSQQYNLIDAATARQVRNLAEQNRLVEAQALLLDSLPGKLADAEQSTTALGRAWRAIATVAGNTWNATGEGIGAFFGDLSGKTDEELQAILDAPFAGRGRSGSSWAQKQEAELELARRQNRADDSEAAAARQRVTAASTIADASAALSGTNRETALRNQIAALTTGIETARTDGETPDEEIRRQTMALNAKQRALAGLGNQQENLLELDRLDIRIANEKNAVLRAELEARRKQLEFASQEATQSKVDFETKRAYNNVIEATIAGTKAQIDQINAETEIRVRLNAQVAAGIIPAADVNRLLQEELQLRPLIAAADIAGIENKKELTEALEGLRKAYADAAEEQRRSANEQALRAGQQELALLQARIGLVGMETAERRRALAVLEEEKKLKELRVDENDPQYAERIEQAKKIADAESELDRAESNRDAIRTRQESIESLKTQMALIGATSAEQRRALAVLEEKNRLTREGIALDSEAGRTRLALAAAEAELTSAVERRQAQYEALRSQGEDAERLRAEINLVGASEAVRRRELAVLEEMQALRREGLSIGDREAQQRLQNVRNLADMETVLERQRDAWGEVRSAQEDVVRSALDFKKLASGDFSGVLEDMVNRIGQTVLDLGAVNPILNGTIGTNYGTFDDLRRPGENILSTILGVGQSVAAMNVHAATVIVNGGVAAGPGGILPGAANDNLSLAGLTAGSGQTLNYVRGIYDGVDARLKDILEKTAMASGFRVDAISGLRSGDTDSFHSLGKALDIQLTDMLTGKILPNYQDASAFGEYEGFAQLARMIQMRDYPELADQFRWGGYFSGPRGKYGALDLMHFDLGGDRVGMGGGSWAGGLTSRQMAFWPGIQSNGMQASRALEALAQNTGVANQGLGLFGNGLNQFGQALGNVQIGGGASGGGGGLFGWLGNLFGGIFGGGSQMQIAQANVAAGTAGLYADGGPIVGPGGPRDDMVPIWASNGEFMVNAEATAKHRPILEAINSGRPFGRFASGGIVETGPAYWPQAAGSGNAASADMRPILQVINNSSAPVAGEVEETTDAKGRRTYRLELSDQLTVGMSAPGGSARKYLEQQGLRKLGVAR